MSISTRTAVWEHGRIAAAAAAALVAVQECGTDTLLRHPVVPPVYPYRPPRVPSHHPLRPNAARNPIVAPPPPAAAAVMTMTRRPPNAE